MGELGAVEIHTLSEETKEISKPEWDAMRVGYICAHPDVFSRNKANILKLCTKNPRCKIDEVKKNLDRIDKQLEVLSEGIYQVP